jgi:hypothetical protein
VVPRSKQLGKQAYVTAVDSSYVGRFDQKLAARQHVKLAAYRPGPRPAPPIRPTAMPEAIYRVN